MKKKVSKYQKRIEMLIISVLLVLLLLIMILSVQNYQNKKEMFVVDSPRECTKDSDCIIIRGSFCSCEDGGSPQCIPKDQMGEYISTIESCSKGNDLFSKNCGQISCGCVNNICVGQTD